MGREGSGEGGKWGGREVEREGSGEGGKWRGREVEREGSGEKKQEASWRVKGVQRSFFFSAELQDENMQLRNDYKSMKANRDTLLSDVIEQTPHLLEVKQLSLGTPEVNHRQSIQISESRHTTF